MIGKCGKDKSSCLALFSSSNDVVIKQIFINHIVLYTLFFNLFSTVDEELNEAKIKETNS